MRPAMAEAKQAGVRGGRCIWLGSALSSPLAALLSSLLTLGLLGVTRLGVDVNVHGGE